MGSLSDGVHKPDASVSWTYDIDGLSESNMDAWVVWIARHTGVDHSYIASYIIWSSLVKT